MTPVAPPLHLGPLRVDPPVVLAPMAGVTNAAFRALCRDHGAGLYVSEMISARAVVEGSTKTMRMVRFGDGEQPRSVQLAAVDPTTVGAAIRRLVDLEGVDHVDLNFGCPMPKVTRKGAGAALPLHHVLFGRIVAAAVNAAAPVPVTVKMRKGLDDLHVTALRCGRIAEDAGAAGVALHARTAEQRYSGRADWTAIAELKEAVRSVPVLGNGDIWEADDALRMVRETGCDAVVVGRGCLGRPWLFGELADAFAGRPVRPPPTLGEVVANMLRHAHLLAEHLGPDAAARDFRKHLGWYFTGIPVGGQVRRSLALVGSLRELEEGLAALDHTLAVPPEAARMVRGHSDGPRPVVLPLGWLDRCDDPTPPAGADLVVSGG